MDRSVYFPLEFASATTHRLVFPRTAARSSVEARVDRMLAEGLAPIDRRGTPKDAGRAVATRAASDLPFTICAAIQVEGQMHIHQY
jgi:3-oxoacyl-[acyl-carrier protein] reductase